MGVVVYCPRVEWYRRSQNLWADIWTLAIKEDIQTMIGCGVKAEHVALLSLILHSIIARDDIYISQTIDGIIVIDCLTTRGVACQFLLYYHRYGDTIWLIKCVGYIGYVANRKVVVASVFEHCGNTLTLGIKGGDVKDITAVYQTINTIR
jgi:hypothetical protein